MLLPSSEAVACYMTNGRLFASGREWERVKVEGEHVSRQFKASGLAQAEKSGGVRGRQAQDITAFLHLRRRVHGLPVG